MMIQGYPLSEIICAIFIILWGAIRFAGIALLIVGGIWLAMQSALIFIFLILLGAMATVNVKW